MNLINLFHGLPESLPEELVDTLSAVGRVRIERIVSWGQATAPGTWYDQAWSEWVVLLQGQAGLRFEQEETQVLQPGDAVMIPKHCRHRVEWTSDSPPAIWLAVHLGED